MAEQQGPLKTYRGNCHCAAFVYEVSMPEIKQVSRCNCSICYKKGAIWVSNGSDVKFVKGDPSALTDYTFNNKQWAHKRDSCRKIDKYQSRNRQTRADADFQFCPTCGVSVMVVGYMKPLEAGEDRLPDHGINLHTFHHGLVDIENLKIIPFNGKSTPPAYEAPKFTGALPAGFDDLQLYTGSCHCGAVTLAVKSQPLDKDAKGLIECNCSICARYGTPWTYPLREQVVIEGKENMGQYLFNKKIARKNFCKICGVVVSSDTVEATDEQVAQMSELSRGWYNRAKLTIAIGLRCINGLDVQELKPDRMDGYSVIQPKYVEP
ncbi:hypothetical protein RRF57_010267 [Xylaria bambusicola]|uniref:CENP-V/GFA domain-containing protein n=1 Tax=Xylaria bambusicola TaxID=326684 RepID=A0AAN7UUQ4_9PEZI